MAESEAQPESGSGVLPGSDEEAYYLDYQPDGTVRKIPKSERVLEEEVVPGDTYVPLDPLIDPHVVGSFTTTLSQKDRERLYEVIRRVHFRHYPGEFITKKEMDKLIDAWGPKVAQYEIARAVESKMVT